MGDEGHEGFEGQIDGISGIESFFPSRKGSK